MVQIPLPDDVFARWLKSKSSKDIEKVFGRKPDEISPMEVVGKEIRKSPALTFKSVTKEGTSKKSGKKDLLVNYKDLRKEKFYQFPDSVSTHDWKEKQTDIMLYETIKEITCVECTEGLVTCKHCEGSGLVVCKNCKNIKDLQCRECKGEGSITYKFDIYNEQQNKIETQKREITCWNCHGKQTVVCKECGDTKQVVCHNCHAQGGTTCKVCLGTGMMFTLPLSPVPFGSHDEVYFFWDSEMEKRMSKSKILQKGHLHELLDQKDVQPIRIDALKQLDQKRLEEQLGFWNKEASNQVKECKKSFENLKKRGIEEPQFPIEIYALQKIDIETYKKKKFTIYSIGSQDGYIVFDLGF